MLACTGALAEDTPGTGRVCNDAKPLAAWLGVVTPSRVLSISRRSVRPKGPEPPMAIPVTVTTVETIALATFSGADAVATEVELEWWVVLRTVGPQPDAVRTASRAGYRIGHRSLNLVTQAIASGIILQPPGARKAPLEHATTRPAEGVGYPPGKTTTARPVIKLARAGAQVTAPLTR